MSTQALRAAAGADTTSTAVATTAPQKQTIAGLLIDPKVKAQMALALPKHLTAERLARIALTEVRKNPKLGACDQASFLGAIMQCAALGLEPGGALGHCYLLPFENRNKGITEVQFIIGYRGMIDLARRSGQIKSIEARVVHAKDKFRVSFGLEGALEHEPAWEEADRGPIKFAYAVAHLKDGGVQFEVMSIAEIYKIRDASQGYKMAKKYGKDSPWITHEEEMDKKTVIRRLFKYLPVSIEIQTAVGVDEQADRGETQDTPLMGEFTDISPQRQLPSDPSGADADGEITAAEVRKAIETATTRATLDAAADLIRFLPDDEQGALRDLFDARTSELK